MSFDESTFEPEVMRIARLLWPAARIGGAVIENGRERDGVFITEEMVHLIECTISRRKEKAEQDVNKLVRLASQMRNRYPAKGVKGWFVTLDEPTPDQRSIAAKFSDTVYATSYRHFRSQLIDASQYISCRTSYQFGSMQDLSSGRYDAQQINANFRFVQLDMISDSGEKWTVKSISESLPAGKAFILFGDYGAGKSTLMRELFLELVRRYQKKSL